MGLPRRHHPPPYSFGEDAGKLDEHAWHEEEL